MGIDTVVAIEIRNRAALPQMFNAERTGAMTADCTKPTHCCRMAVDDNDEHAVRRNVTQQPLDMAPGVDETAFARTRRRSPSGTEPIS